MKALDKEAIRAKLVADNKSLNRLFARKRKNCKKALELIKAEPSKAKRKKLIDFLFADKVEEMFEFVARQEYL